MAADVAADLVVYLPADMAGVSSGCAADRARAAYPDGQGHQGSLQHPRALRGRLSKDDIQNIPGEPLLPGAKFLDAGLEGSKLVQTRGVTNILLPLAFVLFSQGILYHLRQIAWCSPV